MVWYHIQPGHAHFPNQSHAHKFLIGSYPQSVRPSCWFARATVLTFLPGFKYHCPQQVSRSEDDRLRESFPETAKIVSKNTLVRKRFLFFYSVLLHCPSSDRPFISSMCCSSLVNVALTCPLFFANRQHPPKILARTAAISGSTTCGRFSFQRYYMKRSV